MDDYLRIDLEPAFRLDGRNWRGHDRAMMFHNGEYLGESRQPLLDASRILLARGASPAAIIETYRGNKPSMRARVGTAAGQMLQERSNGWIGFVKYHCTSEVFQKDTQLEPVV